MGEQVSNKGFAIVIEELAGKIERGYSFSQAINEYPKVFNRVLLGWFNRVKLEVTLIGP